MADGRERRSKTNEMGSNAKASRAFIKEQKKGAKGDFKKFNGTKNHQKSYYACYSTRAKQETQGDGSVFGPNIPGPKTIFENCGFLK